MNQDNLDLLLNAKANSIGNNKKQKLEIRTKIITKKVLTVLLAVSLSLCLCSCGNILAENGEEYNFSYQSVGMYEYQVATNLEYNLEQNNLDFYKANNTIEEYNSIKEYLDEKDMLIYYDKLGEKECEKICIVLGYQGLNDYLQKNGYLDNQGSPSINVLRAETYERITEEMAEKSK